LIEEAQALVDDDFMDGINSEKKEKTLNGIMLETWTSGMISKPW
jgi:hypothetical protein